MSGTDRGNVDAVFAALADPTRRAVLEQLSTSGEASATELARHFPVSRQAVTKHLQALDAAGLVARRRDGRVTRYGMNAAPLHEVVGWMAAVGGAWDRRLNALEELVSGGS